MEFIAIGALNVENTFQQHIFAMVTNIVRQGKMKNIVMLI
jgi:hypothetical protein